MASNTEVRYVCSICGYSSTTKEVIVKHIGREHGGTGRVMEYESTGEAWYVDLFDRVTEWIERRFR